MNIRDDREGLDDSFDDEEKIPEYLTVLQARSLKIKQIWGFSIPILIVMLLMVFSTTGSLNPLSIYGTNDLPIKILFSVFAVALGILILQLLILYILEPLQYSSLRRSVEIGTGRSADSAICPSCGLSVFQNYDTLGLPIVCHSCHMAWHDGPQCYRKGMPFSNALLPNYPCPNCRSSAGSD